MSPFRFLPYAILALFVSTSNAQNVTTWHNDINRTGWQSAESVLTAATGSSGSVNQTSFGLLWQWTGFNGVMAQPLAVSNLPATGCNPCDLVFIATEDDKLYAYNAASNSQTPVWSADLAAAAGGTAVSCTGSGASLAICQPAPDSGTLGVTGTPVIDTASKLLYAVGVVSKNNTVEYDLFAVNILTGSVNWVAISGSVTGKAPTQNCQTTYPSTGTVQFDPSNSRQRGALLLLNSNMVYIPIAPAAPESNNGWIFGYKYVPGTPTGIFTQVAVFNTTPYGTGGGIWQSGAGLAAEVRQDGTTYLYATTGNGTFDLSGVTPFANDSGDTAMKLFVNNSNGSLHIADYYTPYNVLTYSGQRGTGLCKNDADFGSGGILVFPEAFYTDLSHNPSTTPNLSVNGDKQSNLYVLNRDSMGHFVAAGGNLVELEPVHYSGQQAPTGQGFWSTPAYWKYMDGTTPHYLYASVTSDATNPVPDPYPIDMYELATSGISGPIPASPNRSSTTVFCKFSPTPVVSSNGTTAGTGIVWGVERPNTHDNGGNPHCDGDPVPSAALHAFNANTMAELYTSRALTTLGNASAFLSPTVFQSRVYVGTSAKVNVFGLCASYQRGCAH